MGVFLPNSPQVGVELLVFPPPPSPPSAPLHCSQERSNSQCCPCCWVLIKPTNCTTEGFAHPSAPRWLLCTSFERSCRAGEELTLLLCLQTLPT